MKPHGSKVIEPEEQLGQLKPGHYLRLTIPADGAFKLHHLIKSGQLRAKEPVHELLRHATQHHSWPSRNEHHTLRVDPTETFDAELFVVLVWPFIKEALVIPSSPKRPQQKTRNRVAKATNRDKRTK